MVQMQIGVFYCIDDILTAGVDGDAVVGDNHVNGFTRSGNVVHSVQIAGYGPAAGER